MKTRVFILMSIILLACNSIQAQKKQQPVYLMGFAASFNDSIVYLTDIQLMDSAYIEPKNKFLYARDSYSFQLKEYLEKNGIKNPTCVTLFANSQKAIEKKYLKLNKRYTKGNHYQVNYLNQSQFRFSSIHP